MCRHRYGRPPYAEELIGPAPTQAAAGAGGPPRGRSGVASARRAVSAAAAILVGVPRFALIVLVPLLVLAGCGDDGVSREDYIADADALCERLNEQIEDVNQPRPTNLGELRELLDDAIEVTREGIAELEELDPPEEVDDDVDDFLDSARDQEQLLENARDAGSFEEGGQILRERLPPVAEARRDAAEEIGFEECGRGS